ncbi:hypothetical protein BDC45DRAFT_104933 [Circinella umbellata]|nr:hypothetical protein BDC45DRAFT_104933 [Circinella umbellata]
MIPLFIFYTYIYNHIPPPPITITHTFFYCYVYNFFFLLYPVSYNLLSSINPHYITYNSLHGFILSLIHYRLFLFCS